MSFQVNNFDDTAKWSVYGTGTVTNRTATSFQATTTSPTAQYAGLVSTAQNLSDVHLSVMATRATSGTKFGLYDPNVVDWGMERNSLFGVLVWLDQPYTFADPVAPDVPAEMRISISGGMATFYYNGVQLAGPVALPGWLTGQVYLVVVNQAADGGITNGTTTFTATGTTPLSVTANATTSTTITGPASVSFQATASGGSGNYTYQWHDDAGAIDGATNNSLSLDFPQVTVQTLYHIYVVVNDGVNSPVSSNSITVTDNPPAVTYNLTVTQPSNGAVTTNPVAGNYPAGTTVTVTATPDTSYTLTAITVNGTSISMTSPASFALNANSIVSATFTYNPTNYTLTVTQAPNGVISTIPAAGTYISGTSVTVTATPNNGYYLSAITVNGSTASTTSPYTFPLVANSTVSAVFSAIPTGFVIGNFDNTSLWQKYGSETVQNIMQDSFSTVTTTANFTGLLATNLDLTSADLRVLATRGATKAMLGISSGIPVTDPDSDFNTITIARDANYGIMVWISGGVAYIGADPVAANTSAELRITVANGMLSFYYNGNLLTLNQQSYVGLTSVPIPAWIPLPLNTVIIAGLGTGTNTYYSTGYVPPTWTLTITAGANGSVAFVGGGPTFNDGATAQVQATPNATYMLDYWELDGVAVGSANPYSLVMRANHTLNAVFKIGATYPCPYGDGLVFFTQEELDAHIALVHSGKLTDWFGTLLVGKTYVVSMQPSVAVNGVDWAFDHWLDDVNNKNPTRSFLFDGEKTFNGVYVSQAVPTYTLAISSTAGGSTTPSGTQTYDEGTVVSVTATALQGYSFTKWILDGVDTNVGISTISVSMSTNHTLQAVFTQDTVYYTLSLSSTAGGSTTPSGTQTYMAGDVASVTARPNVGYKFDNWLLDGVAAGNANPHLLTMNANHTLQAVFSVVTFTLTVSSNIVGGPSGTQTVPQGTVLQTYAPPLTGYIFDHWVIDGATDDSANPINITMDANHTLEAVYVAAPTTITLTVTAGVGGSVSPSGTQTLTIGQSYQFFETEDTGYDFDYWDLSGENKGSSKPSIILNVTIDMDEKTLTAMFTTEPPPQVTMTLAIAGNGTTDIAPGTQTFNVGATVQITAIPQAGATFYGWKLDGADYSTENPLNLVVTSDLNGKTLTADFVTLGQAGFPWWMAAIAGVGALGVYYLSRNGKK